jgi:hypothetical protein
MNDDDEDDNHDTNKNDGGGGEGGEEENGEDDDNDDAFARMMEEVEREIERAKKQTDFFCSSSSHVGSTENALSGVQRGEEEEEAGKENETKEKEKKRERNRARREAVEWRRKKIEEKTFDPRAAFRERVKKKRNKNDENIDENAWQSPSVVMRRRRAENISVSTRKKSWTELEIEWKRLEEKWKESQDDDDDDNESGNEKQRRQRRSALRFQDIPFPPSGAGFLAFLISDQGPFSDDENGKKKARRELAKRWHPDKFAQKFSRLLKDEDREDVMELVKEVYQSGTALMNTLSWDG